VKLASLGWCHKWGECAKSCARRSVSFCSESRGRASIVLLTYQLQSCGRSRRTVRFVRLVFQVVMKRNGHFMDVILLYS
jgi:hypothetical protein